LFFLEKPKIEKKREKKPRRKRKLKQTVPNQSKERKIEKGGGREQGMYFGHHDSFQSERNFCRHAKRDSKVTPRWGGRGGSVGNIYAEGRKL